jgi:chitinase
MEEIDVQFIPIEINDEVTALPHKGRYVVVGLDGSFAKLQLFADDKQTMERRYWVDLISVPIQGLTIIGKNHTRPAKFKLIP